MNKPEVKAANGKLKCGLKTLAESACALAEAISCKFIIERNDSALVKRLKPKAHD